MLMEEKVVLLTTAKWLNKRYVAVIAQKINDEIGTVTIHVNVHTIVLGTFNNSL